MITITTTYTRKLTLTEMRCDLRTIMAATNDAKAGYRYEARRVHDRMSRKYAGTITGTYNMRRVRDEIRDELRRLERALDADTIAAEAYAECLVAYPKTTIGVTVGVLGLAIAAAILSD